uniref:Ion transport domain-containing protein n=1 Tax=Gasterosteus aculeatus aculeatus TaxID=481459 RepID=A0AAQ4REY1_GASAC
MFSKMFAMGLFGYKGSYLSNYWNRLDLLINLGEFFDFFMDHLGLHLQVSQVLGPLRLISRVASMRDIVSAVLFIFPMLANVLCLYMFVVHIFGVIGVQLWAGRLRNRCFLGEDPTAMYNVSLSPYYVNKYGELQTFLCSPEGTSGRHCGEVPPNRENHQICSLAPPAPSVFGLTGAGTNACVNWNVLYNVCRAGAQNPNSGATNFDNIGYAWISIFQVVTLEGWSNIMFYVMNVYSFWSFLYFIFVVIMGSYIMMNVCGVVISTQFSDNLEHLRRRETRRENSDVLGEWLCSKWTGCLAVIRRRASNRVHHHDDDSRADDLTVKGHIWGQLRTRLEKVVNSKVFDRLIACAVLLSILTLAIQHHNQPNVLTNILQICDLTFTVIFVVEMLLKWMVLKWAYFEDRNNLLHFVIVIISLSEMRTKEDDWLSVLRAFRLLHYLPYLRTQLLVLKKAMQEAASLCMLILFVLFVFSLVGMHLFGHGLDTRNTINDRKNFDTLLWSMVTVFQILTEENWNTVLYNIMAETSPWAFIYFVAVIVMGKHVLLNILVGIVHQGFQDRRTLGESPSSVTSSPTSEDGSADTNGDEENRTLGQSPSSVTPTPTVEHGSADVNGDERSQNRNQTALRWCKKREEWSFYVLSPQNRLRLFCKSVTSHHLFEYTVLLFILLNCITIAMERPGIEPGSKERTFLTISGFVFSAVFMVEMLFKVLTLGLFIGSESYCRSAWNIVDGLLVVASVVDIVVLLSLASHSKMLDILKVLRLLRILRALRVVKRSPKLKLAVEALIIAVKPVGNILLLCCALILFYAILGLQLFKGKFYICRGEFIDDVTNKTDCLSANQRWELKDFNFDSLPQALLSLFVMYSKDGWVTLMYDGLDAVGVDQQPMINYNVWILPFFISFMIVSYFLLDMFIGVMVHTFHDCQKKQNKLSEEARNSLRRGAGEDVAEVPKETPYQASYSRMRLSIHTLCTSGPLDLFIAVLIVISVLIMAVEHYQEPLYIKRLTEYSHYVFTSILLIEVLLKLVAFGGLRFLRNSWNLVDLVIVSVSITSIALNMMSVSQQVPVNPTILTVLRVLRMGQVLKAKRIRVLLTTIGKTLSQVGNICLLFLFFFTIYATLGVEFFGHLECAEDELCLGLNEYVNFKHFGMALFTLFLVCTGDNWSMIMMDTLKQCRPGECSLYLTWVSPIYFITFVVIAQFVLANLVVAVIVQALEDSNKDEGVSGLSTAILAD